MANVSILAAGILIGCGLAGCNSDNAPEFEERFVEACTTASNMPEPVCDCLAKRATTQISEDARTLLVAMLEGDEDTIVEMRGNIPVTDAMQAGMFMTEAGECAAP